MTLPFKYDLHIHTTFSDGSLKPEEVLHLANQLQLRGLSITDHDTVEAYSESLFYLAKDLNLELITGVEFSCSEKNVTVHILGYGFDYRHPLIRELCLRHVKIREARNRAIIEKLAKKGFKISLSDLEAQRKEKNQVLGRPHIAQILLALGHVRNSAEAFERYLADGKSCYVEPNNPSIEETIQIIQKANGKAILAHPYLFKKRKILKEILKKPFDGIECYYAKMRRDLVDQYIKIAQEKNWLITGGSDFHGGSKPFLGLGSSFIQEEDFIKLKTL